MSFLRSVLVLLTLLVVWNTNGGAEERSWSFIQQAEAGKFDGTMLILQGVSPRTVAFTDRPGRTVRSVPTDVFVEQVWRSGSDAFANDPPNTTIAFEVDGDLQNAVIEISAPSLEGTMLRYTVDLLDGEIPATFVAPILIIDPAWNPGPGG